MEMKIKYGNGKEVWKCQRKARKSNCMSNGENEVKSGSFH
jgi:hypothetical protein